MEPVSAALTVWGIITTFTTATKTLNDLLKNIRTAYDELEALKREIDDSPKLIGLVEDCLNNPKVTQHIERNPHLRGHIELLKCALGDCTVAVKGTTRLIDGCILANEQLNIAKWVLETKGKIARMREDLRHAQGKVSFVLIVSLSMQSLREQAGATDASTAHILPSDAAQHNAVLEEALLKAVRDGAQSRAEALIRLGTGVDCRDMEGRTPLSIAAEVGNEDLAKFFILNGADVNSAAKRLLGDRAYLGRRTPLHWASARGHKKLVALLFEHHAKLEVKSHGGKSPICEACNKNNVSLVQFMLKKGADIGVRTTGGSTLLSVAVSRGYFEMAKLLIEHNADVEAKYMGSFSRTGQDTAAKNTTPIFYAAFPSKKSLNQQKLDMLRLLVKAKVDVVDNLGATPLHYAVRADWPEGVKDLLDRKASAIAKNSKEVSPIDEAAALGHAECLGLLLRSLKKPSQLTDKVKILALVQEGSRQDDVIKVIDKVFNAEQKSVKSDGACAKKGLESNNKVKQKAVDGDGDAAHEKEPAVGVNKMKQNAVDGNEVKPKKKTTKEPEPQKQASEDGGAQSQEQLANNQKAKRRASDRDEVKKKNSEKEGYNGDEPKKKAARKDRHDEDESKSADVSQQRAKQNLTKEPSQKGKSPAQDGTKQGCAKDEDIRQGPEKDSSEHTSVKPAKPKPKGTKDTCAKPASKKKEAVAQNGKGSENRGRQDTESSVVKQSTTGSTHHDCGSTQVGAKPGSVKTSKVKHDEAKGKSMKEAGTKRDSTKASGKTQEGVKPGSVEHNGVNPQKCAVTHDGENSEAVKEHSAKRSPANRIR
ncbi:hypothetical protein Q7P37_004276 [Cladosporium fusiforme]